MDVTINIDERQANVRLLARNGNSYTIQVDEQVYEIDAEHVAKGVYSILLNGTSYNVELSNQADKRAYTVNTFYHTHHVEVVDALARFMQNRTKNDMQDEASLVKSPMPGKVVDVLVEEGQEVEKGQAVIILSAMKMESEFKAAKAGRVAAIFVEKGQNVIGNQELIEIG